MHEKPRKVVLYLGEEAQSAVDENRWERDLLRNFIFLTFLFLTMWIRYLFKHTNEAQIKQKLALRFFWKKVGEEVAEYPI